MIGKSVLDERSTECEGLLKAPGLVALQGEI